MKGDFENIWKDALDGASVTPSENLWKGIESAMDQKHGKTGWVTILLIAATVTIAFAFPLTIGNSSFELKPKEYEIASQLPGQSSDTGEEPAIDLPTRDNNLPSRNMAHDYHISKNESSESSASAQARSQAIKSSGSQGITTELIKEEGKSLLTEVRAKRVISFYYFLKEPASALDSYYILPAYNKPTKTYDGNLLAYGRLNSGRQTSSSGFESMDLLFSRTETMDASPANDLGNNQYDNRSEEGGTAFYLGFGVEIPMSRRFRLTTGLGVQNQRLTGSSNVIDDNNGLELPLGIYDPIAPGAVFLNTNYDYVSSNQFISLPIAVKYIFVDKKVKFRGGVGLSPDFMLSHKIISEDYGTNSVKPSETYYNSFQLSGLFNFDVMFSLGSNYGLAVETGLRQGLRPIVTHGSDFATSFNLGVVLFYQFDK